MDNRSITHDMALTLDVDWAPDFMIDFAAAILVENRVRATWFVTHASPALARLRAHPDLFEIGIHPNFFPGSTHGDSPAAVLRHCLELVPEAVSIRTHGLFQSTALLERVMHETAILTDASLYLPRAKGLEPIEYEWARKTLLRVPHFWEDDFEMEREAPCWNLAPLLSDDYGLRVFDFHPIHVYLNSSTPRAYRQLKQAVPNLAELTSDQANGAVQIGTGTRTLFNELVAHFSKAGDSMRISDIHGRWQRSRGKEVERAQS